MPTETRGAARGIMDCLRVRTRTWHETLEATPFSLAMQDGTLRFDQYVGQLVAYEIVLDTLEALLLQATHRTVVQVWSADLVKVHLLKQDLRFIGKGLALSVAPVTIAAAEEFASMVSCSATDSPVTMLGALYVMEGSTLGGLGLRKHLESAFHLTKDRGLAYYSSGDRERWVRFRTRMDNTVTSRDEQDQVIAAATDGYQRIAAILATLSPRSAP